MNDRIKQIQLALNMSQKDFADAIGIAPGALSNIYSGRTNATSNHVNGIHKAFPNINVNWLMFGEGDMYVNNSDTLPTEGQASPSADDIYNNVETGEAPFTPDLFAVSTDAHGTHTMSARAGVARENSGAPRTSAHGVAGVPPARQQPVSGYTSDAKNIDIVRPKIKEIRVFYDDGTYETFTPSK